MGDDLEVNVSDFKSMQDSEDDTPQHHPSSVTQRRKSMAVPIMEGYKTLHTRTLQHRGEYSTIDWYSCKAAMHRSRLQRQLYNAKRGWKGRLVNLTVSMQGWLVLLLVGMATAATASWIHILSNYLHGLKIGVCTTAPFVTHDICCISQIGGRACSDWKTWYELIGVDTGPGAFVVGLLVYVTLSVFFAVLCAWLILKYKPQAAGSGIAEVKTILAGFVIKGFLGAWALVLKALGLVLAVSSGLCLGKEGPLIHIACCYGNIISRRFYKFRSNPVKQREILSAASAAGVASAFGAPLGGVLFSLESVSSYFPPKVMWRSFFCAITSTLVIQYMNPFGSDKNLLFEITYDHPWHSFELVAFVFLGVFGGMFGALFLYCNLRINNAALHSPWVKKHPILLVAGFTLITACINYSTPFTRASMSDLLSKLFSDCRSTQTEFSSTTDASFAEALATALQFKDSEIEKILCGEKTGQIFGLLLFTFIVKLTLTMFTFGAILKVPAGVFLPALCAGACFGRMVGEGLHVWHLYLGDTYMFSVCAGRTQCISPAIYASIGAAAVLGGITRMTISLTVIMFELTGGLQNVVPVMLASLCSKWVGDYFGNKGVYDMMIAVRGYPFVRRDVSVNGICLTWAADILTPNPVCVPAYQLTPALLKQHLKKYSYMGFPVVRSMHDMQLMGFITRQNLEKILTHFTPIHPLFETGILALASIPVQFSTAATTAGNSAGTTGSTARNASLPHSLSHSLSSSTLSTDTLPDLTTLVFDCRSFVDQHPVSIAPDTPNDRVQDLFTGLGLRYCVVTQSGAVVGVIKKIDLLMHMELMSEKDETQELYASFGEHEHDKADGHYNGTSPVRKLTSKELQAMGGSSSGSGRIAIKNKSKKRGGADGDGKAEAFFHGEQDSHTHPEDSRQNRNYNDRTEPGTGEGGSGNRRSGERNTLEATLELHSSHGQDFQLSLLQLGDLQSPGLHKHYGEPTWKHELSLDSDAALASVNKGSPLASSRSFAFPVMPVALTPPQPAAADAVDAAADAVDADDDDAGSSGADSVGGDVASGVIHQEVNETLERRVSLSVEPRKSLGEE